MRQSLEAYCPVMQVKLLLLLPLIESHASLNEDIFPRLIRSGDRLREAIIQADRNTETEEWTKTETKQAKEQI